jgi:hypothetical protein
MIGNGPLFSSGSLLAAFQDTENVHFEMALLCANGAAHENAQNWILNWLKTSLLGFNQSKVFTK